jgi:branched-chain amino acid transport system substrate-binding protein
VIGVNASPVGSRDAAFVWRTSYADDALGRVLGRYLAEQHGTTPVYVVGPDGPAAREVVEAFGATFTATSGRAPAAVELTPAGAVDFRAALGRVRAAGARALFCAYGGAAGVAFVRQYRELLGADGPALYGPGSLTEGAMLADLGSAARNVYTVADYSPDLDNAANRRFSAEYVKVFGRAPSAYAVASYDAATVLDRAIRRTGAQLTALTLNAALATIGPVDSPRGAWRFTDDRSPTQRWYLRQVRSAGDGLANAVASELRAPG